MRYCGNNISLDEQTDRQPENITSLPTMSGDKDTDDKDGSEALVTF